jgi:internalin A
MTTQHPGAPAQPSELKLYSKHDLSALRTLTDPSRLATLTLYDSDFSDLGPLAGLTHLTTLEVINCTQVRNLGPLAGLLQLTRLTLWHCPQIQDLRPLAELKALTDLSLGYCPQVSDLSPLAGLTQLTRLDLRGNGRRIRAGRLRPLAGLPHLTILR